MMTRIRSSQLVMLLSFAVLLTACKGKDAEITPTADFTYALADQSLATYLAVYPTGDGVQLTNNSTNGASYLWDFGDGTASTAQAPVVYYQKSGMYTITLTTTSTTGAPTTTKKSITIVDRVLKRITIRQLNWNAFDGLPTWTGSKRADLIIELGLRTQTSSSIIPASVLYRSAPLPNITNTTTAFDVPVTGNVVIGPDIINKLLINVLGNDGNGDKITFSSGGSGIGVIAGFNTVTRLYTINSGALGTAVTIECAYE